MTRREALKRTALLLGAALSPSTIATALAEAIRDPHAAPRHLTASQFATVQAFAERLLPRTTTPGAADVGVAQFIDLCFGDFLTPSEKSMLTTGLAWLDEVSRSRHGEPFASLDATDQDDVMRQGASAEEPKSKQFLRKMRELCLSGYFNSEAVGTTVLNYDPVPGRLDPCISVDEVNNIAWTEG